MQPNALPAPESEWLEADGLGGFASGTVSGLRTRRYHAWLLPATTPPTGRVVLVNGIEAWVTHEGRRTAITAQRYAPDVVYPDGASRLVAFHADPWPTWVWRLEDGLEVEQQLVVPHGAPVTVVRWLVRGARDTVRLEVRPLLSGRDYHAVHHENPGFDFTAHPAGSGRGTRISWRPYGDLPPVVSVSNGTYRHDPTWYRNFLLSEEQARGLDCIEDLASPGVLEWDIGEQGAAWVLGTDGARATEWLVMDAEDAVRDAFGAERRRRGRFPSRLHRAADAYLVSRGSGKTIIAGYPWFTDWGRDTFIALRGLCLAGGRLDEAADILVEWAGTVSRGMLPNRFPDQGGEPEFNAVDASLWYIVAVHDLLRAMETSGRRLPARQRQVLVAAVEEILEGYRAGTRYGIGMDTDGLLRAGEAGVQLTWMDAKVGDWVVTPRIGKPVEIQALWYNALRIGGAFNPRWLEPAEQVRDSFAERFWCASGEYLHDVVDADHVPGRMDASFRPNQIFAVGGLPWPLLEGDRARRVVEAVQEQLYTPIGLRSLDPGDPAYVPHYRGGPLQRDGAYHQGTVWPFLLGPFVEAWVRVRGNDAATRREGREQFLRPLLAHLDLAGLGHISEVADGDAPHTPGGCPFQAWSVG
ncbi:MAG: amylo-alpha-1,6-glucosidase, partial [Gemmatimonadales bacterium]